MNIGSVICSNDINVTSKVCTWFIKSRYQKYMHHKENDKIKNHFEYRRC